jgi:hypothetical protein
MAAADAATVHGLPFKRTKAWEQEETKVGRANCEHHKLHKKPRQRDASKRMD